MNNTNDRYLHPIFPRNKCFLHASDSNTLAIFLDKTSFKLGESIINLLINNHNSLQPIMNVANHTLNIRLSIEVNVKNNGCGLILSTS
jgi:hypothetical protein